MMSLGIFIFVLGLILGAFGYLTESGLKKESRQSQVLFLAAAGLLILGTWFVQMETVPL